MYASVRTYRIGAGSIDDLMHRVDEEFAPMLSTQPGFCSYQAIDCGNDTLLSVTVFSDEEGAKQSALLASRWIADNLAEFQLTRLDVKLGEVMVSRALAEVLEPAHH